MSIRKAKLEKLFYWRSGKESIRALLFSKVVEWNEDLYSGGLMGERGTGFRMQASERNRWFSRNSR
jgi:hypothetical protein